MKTEQCSAEQAVKNRRRFVEKWRPWLDEQKPRAAQMLASYLATGGDEKNTLPFIFDDGSGWQHCKVRLPLDRRGKLIAHYIRHLMGLELALTCEMDDPDSIANIMFELGRLGVHLKGSERAAKSAACGRKLSEDEIRTAHELYREFKRNGVSHTAALRRVAARMQAAHGVDASSRTYDRAIRANGGGPPRAD